jgi:hypothetical protein
VGKEYSPASKANLHPATNGKDFTPTKELGLECYHCNTTSMMQQQSGFSIPSTDTYKFFSSQIQNMRKIESNQCIVDHDSLE